MTYASPAIDLRATKADRDPGVLTAGGAALALGSIGVTVTSVLYALSPPAAALPAYPLDLALTYYPMAWVGWAQMSLVAAAVAMLVGGAAWARTHLRGR